MPNVILNFEEQLTADVALAEKLAGPKPSPPYYQDVMGEGPMPINPPYSGVTGIDPPAVVQLPDPNGPHKSADYATELAAWNARVALYLAEIRKTR